MKITHVHNHKAVHNHKTEIQENRAPTDDSIRLLQEMEKKVKDNFISRERITINELVFDAIYFQEDHNLKITLLFNLNGKEFKVEERIEFRQHMDDWNMFKWESIDEAPRFVLLTQVSRIIANELIGHNHEVIQLYKKSRR